ncbi:hypothetical protein [Erwinia mallotivora]|uniref:hypothetical protein n=2 Tax=Erwinia mallotivora TaxID=69222 RepID=UPI0021C1B1C1|nr:hypothetical protein [Erwinia mallotivora]
MNIVNNSDNIVQHYQSDDATEYQRELLKFIKQNKPHNADEYNASSLSGLLEMMKEKYQQINPQRAPTLSELNSALLYVDGQLRNNIDKNTTDPDQLELNNYVQNNLGKYAIQLTSVNMLFNQMINRALFPEEDQELEKF